MEQSVKMTDQLRPELESVVFKGYKSGLCLLFPETGPFEQHLRDLKSRLKEANGFFKGAGVRLQQGSRIFRQDQWQELTAVLSDAGLVLQIQNEEAKAKKIGKKIISGEPESLVRTLTVRETLRSGQQISFQGNLLVTGDVNPGAEIIAGGDIIVLGKLRGTAHAGAAGNTAARIIALQLKPLQIRIADVFTRAPEAERKRFEKKYHPEIARIKDGYIIVETFNWDFTRL